MIALRMSSNLGKMLKGVERQAAQVQRAIAQGLNEGGNKVRTQEQKAMREQTGLTKLASVTKRQRTILAFPGKLEYTIVVSGKPPTKPDEFKKQVTTGPGGGVTVWLWNVAHKFKRSFRGSGKIAGQLKMRTTGPRLPIRGFDGPNLAKEAVKGQVAATFIRESETIVPAMIEKRLARIG